VSKVNVLGAVDRAEQVALGRLAAVLPISVSIATESSVTAIEGAGEVCSINGTLGRPRSSARESQAVDALSHAAASVVVEDAVI